MEYKELEDVMSKINFESNAKAFISTYTSTLQTCLIKFSNIPNVDFCKNLLMTLSKIFQNFVIDKLNKMGEKINLMNENYSQENNINIENLNNEIKNLNEQIDKNRKLLEETNKEKSEINKNFLELENKYEKLNRESKTKEKEYENNLKIEIQKYQKMETYYNSQIKEKEQKIINLESKIENLNHEILGSEKPSMKEDELNSQNNNPSESQIVKNEDGKEKPMVSDEQTSNLQNLFKNMQTTFMELKIKVDKIDKENENIFKSQNLENYTIIFEEKLNTCINEVKTFFEKQIKE
jgi:chromosome segregation ATPase